MSAWLEHVKNVKAQNGGLQLKDVLKLASKTYKKGGAAQETKSALKGAPLKGGDCGSPYPHDDDTFTTMSGPSGQESQSSMAPAPLSGGGKSKRGKSKRGKSKRGKSKRGKSKRCKSKRCKSKRCKSKSCKSKHCKLKRCKS